MQGCEGRTENPLPLGMGSVNEIGKYGTDTAQAAETENLKTVESKGVTVIDLDDATIAQMKEKAAPVYDMVREAVGNDLVDEYLAAIEAAK